MTVRIAVLASGSGTNLQALIDYLAALGQHASAQIILVASNRTGAKALERARSAGIAAEEFSTADRGEALQTMLRSHAIEMVVLAGYMKHLPPSIIESYEGRILNVHPALLPAFGGAGMYGSHVHEAVIAARATTTGVTVHLVDNEFDHGAIVAQWRIPVSDDDTAESLARRVLDVEHVVYPRVVNMVAALMLNPPRPPQSPGRVF
ncbi:MAG: phosphoribosylglycinamide formyltransferase [Gemmatimonadaceae bacterium]